MTDSMFNRGGSGNTRGGLDRFLGPAGKDYSKVPDDLTDGKADEDAPTEADVDCGGKDADDPLCQIKRAVDEAKTNPDDAPPGDASANAPDDAGTGST